MNSFTSKNQIPTTNITLPIYQERTCVTLKISGFKRYIADKEIILIEFTIKNERKANAIIFILFKMLMFGTERLNINNKKYAEPATHASIISIGENEEPIKIVVPEIVAPKRISRIK